MFQRHCDQYVSMNDKAMMSLSLILEDDLTNFCLLSNLRKMSSEQTCRTTPGRTPTASTICVENRSVLSYFASNMLMFLMKWNRSRDTRLSSKDFSTHLDVAISSVRYLVIYELISNYMCLLEGRAV